LSGTHGFWAVQESLALADGVLVTAAGIKAQTAISR
jgi:hypothetical protein